MIILMFVLFGFVVWAEWNGMELYKGINKNE